MTGDFPYFEPYLAPKNDCLDISRIRLDFFSVFSSLFTWLSRLTRLEIWRSENITKILWQSFIIYYNILIVLLLYIIIVIDDVMMTSLPKCFFFLCRTFFCKSFPWKTPFFYFRKNFYKVFYWSLLKCFFLEILKKFFGNFILFIFPLLLTN